jgi:uncharacterized metal-binding protein YceD (DUF177 family)
MKALKAYSINFVGLKEGKHRFEYHLDKKFLEIFENPLVEDLDIRVNLVLDKHNTLLELNFDWKGTVAAVCDVCNEDFNLPVEGKEKLIVKFVHEIPEDAADELEIIYIKHGESAINIALPMYEALVLQIPFRKVHPDDEHGQPTCNQQVLKYLQENVGDEHAKDSNEEEQSASIWDELKKLK